MLGDEDFIINRGSLDILYILEDGPKSFDEFKPQLKLSPNTIVSRLRTAQSLGIIEQKLIGETKGRSKIKYDLTKKGEKILEASGDIKNRYLELKKEINELRKGIKNKDSEIEKLLLSLREPLRQILKSNPNQK